jgi:hypothetical protein
MLKCFPLNIYRLATTLKFPMAQKSTKFKLIKVWGTALQAKHGGMAGETRAQGHLNGARPK